MNDDIRSAARRVVSAWVSTRPAWIEDVNAAVLALDGALKAQPEPAHPEPAQHYASIPGTNVRVRLQPEPAQGPVAAAFSAAFGAEQHSTDQRIVIERRGETLHLNGQEIGPGTLEIRRDGVTYRAAERVAVKPEPAQEPFSIRDLLTQAAAMAVASERAGKYQGASWVADAVLAQEQAVPAADPFNCPKCGRHDYGLHGACPACYAQQATLAQEQPEPAQEPVACIRTWHKDGEQHAELRGWEDGIEGLPDGEHLLYTAAQPQPETAQEPVAWALSHSRGIEFSSRYPMQASKKAADQMARQHMGAVTVTPLYTAPPQRPPLTDEEIRDAVQEADLDWQAGWTLDEHEPNRFTTLARAIERKVRGETE